MAVMTLLQIRSYMFDKIRVSAATRGTVFYQVWYGAVHTCSHSLLKLVTRNEHVVSRLCYIKTDKL